jgi:hypothetical protein
METENSLRKTLLDPIKIEENSKKICLPILTGSYHSALSRKGDHLSGFDTWHEHSLLIE